MIFILIPTYKYHRKSKEKYNEEKTPDSLINN